uniref:Uncharacterized protein n=1 Tax=Cacopsylla melanoneura TaxID=428564 RepID=A0A8D8TSJ1_9HEMI
MYDRVSIILRLLNCLCKESSGCHGTDILYKIFDKLFFIFYIVEHYFFPSVSSLYLLSPFMVILSSLPSFFTEYFFVLPLSSSLPPFFFYHFLSMYLGSSYIIRVLFFYHSRKYSICLNIFLFS